VVPESGEGLRGTVGGGGEAVRTEADPGEDRDQGDLVEEGGIRDVPLGSDERVVDPGRDALRFRVMVLSCQGPSPGGAPWRAPGGHPPVRLWDQG
jgi:hypothetical protein